MRKSLLLLLCIAITPYRNIMGNNNQEPNYAGIGGVFFATAGTYYLLEQLGENSRVKKACKSLNTSPQDVSNVIGVSLTLGGLGYFTQGQTKNNLYEAATYVPLVAAVGLATSTETYKNIVQKLPFGIGNYLSCSNEECPGVCRLCTMTKSIITVGSYLMLKSCIKSYTN